MRILIVSLIVVAAAGYLVWQQPQVRELFESGERDGEDPLAFLQEEDEELAQARARQKAEVEARKERERARAASSRRSAQGEASQTAKPSVPNAEVSRVLRAVLAAKRIGQQVEIGISDTRVTLSGAVKSEEERREILRLVEKARETRRVDASELTVQP